MPRRANSSVREVLVAHLAADVRRGQEDERRRELVARLGQGDVVEVGERDDQAHVVLADEPGERGDVARIVDARDERVVVGVVERRRQAVGVGDDRRRAGARELGHDVDPLPGAREEDCRHARERSPHAREAEPSGGHRSRAAVAVPRDERGELPADLLQLRAMLVQLLLGRAALVEQPADLQQALEADDQPIQLRVEEDLGGAHTVVVTHHGLLSSCLP